MSLRFRACIGKHLAMVELTICIATVFHRFDFTLENSNEVRTVVSPLPIFTG